MRSERVSELEEKWLESGLFEDEQDYLHARIWPGNEARYVFLDPDGTCGEWLVVAIRYPTDVIYGHQCGGTSCLHRYIEGYIVPLGGLQFTTERGLIQVPALRDVFHIGDGCRWGWPGEEFPAERLAQLVALVEELPYWQFTSKTKDHRNPLRFDQDRIAELAEAWIPVVTPDGPGVLLYTNCD